MHTILIADDNAASPELLRDTLEGIGALLDIQMPLLDGFGVVERVRALEPAPAIHLVALTALAMESDRQRILAAGFDGYVAKPISVSGLRTLVTRVLSGLEDDGHPFLQKPS